MKILNPRLAMLSALLSVSSPIIVTLTASANEPVVSDQSDEATEFSPLEDQAAVYAAVLPKAARAEFFNLLKRAQDGSIDEKGLARLKALIARSGKIVDSADTVEMM